jgi:hypothetical protein
VPPTTRASPRKREPFECDSHYASASDWPSQGQHFFDRTSADRSGCRKLNLRSPVRLGLEAAQNGRKNRDFQRKDWKSLHRWGYELGVEDCRGFDPTCVSRLLSLSRNGSLELSPSNVKTAKVFGTQSYAIIEWHSWKTTKR